MAVGANVVIGLVLVPFLIGVLGREGYGVLALLASIVLFTGMADLGIRTVLSRHIAEQIALRDSRHINELVSSALAINLALGSIMGAACFLAAPLIARLFNVPAELAPQATALVRWYASITVLLSFVLPVFTSVLNGHQRFDITNFIETVTSLLRGAALLLILGSVEALMMTWAAITLGAQLAKLGLLGGFAYRQFPELRIRLRSVKAEAIKSILSFGGYLFLGQAAGLLSLSADPIVLTTFLGPASLALFGPSMSLRTRLRPAVRALAAQLHPLATGYHATGEKTNLQAVLIRGTRYTVLMAIPVCVVMGIFSESIARVWLQAALGEDYRIVGHLLIGWAVADLLAYAGGTQWAVLLAMGRVRTLAFVDAPIALLSLVGSVLLLAYTSLGVVAMVIPIGLLSFVARPVMIVYTARACGISTRKYLRESYGRPSIVLAATGAAAWILERWLNPASLIDLMLCVLAVALAWCPLCWWIGFEQNDRDGVRALLRRARANLLG